MYIHACIHVYVVVECTFLTYVCISDLLLVFTFKLSCCGIPYIVELELHVRYCMYIRTCVEVECGATLKE